MGLIKNIYSGVVSGVGNLATKGLEKVTGKKYGRTTAKEFKESKVGNILGTAAGLTGSALIVATGAEAIKSGAAASAAKKAAGKVAASVAEKGLVKGLIVPATTSVAGAGFLAGGGLLLAKPLFKSSKAATEKAVGVVTGKEKLTKDNAVSVGEAIGIGLGSGVVGAGVGAIVGNVLDNKATPQESGGLLGSSDVMENVGVQTPQTQELTSTTKRKRKKTANKAQQQKINQSVRVYINSQNKTSKKYLNVIPVRN